jgi:hypothetical protein
LPTRPSWNLALQPRRDGPVEPVDHDAVERCGRVDEPLQH